MDEINVKIRCSLCDASSDEVMILMGLFANKQLFVCVNCLTEDITDSRCKKHGN